MTFKRLARSVGSALMYFGIYMMWQFAITFTAMQAVTFSMSFVAGIGTAAQLTQSGEYTFDQLYSAIMSVQLEVVNDAANWILDYAVHLTVLASVLTLATYWLMFALREKNTFREVGLGKMPVLPCFGMVFLGAALNLSVTVLLPLIPFPESWWENQVAQSELLFDVAPWLTFLMAVIVAPILEEILFRGLIYTRLHRGMPMIVAMIASALLFGAVHGTWIAFIYASLLGFLLAWVFEKYNSLLANIMLHLGFNLCATVLEHFEDVSTPVCIVAVAISVLGIVAVQLTTRKKREIDCRAE